MILRQVELDADKLLIDLFCKKFSIWLNHAIILKQNYDFNLF